MDQKTLQVVSEFLKSSPPGEIDDVFNDVRVLVDNDQEFQQSIQEPLKQCNMEQFYVATVDTTLSHPSTSSTAINSKTSPDRDIEESEAERERKEDENENQAGAGVETVGKTVMLTKYNYRTETNEYYDYENKIRFEFDHLRLKAYNVQPLPDSNLVDSNASEAGKIELFRNELLLLAETYIEEHYNGGKSLVTDFMCDKTNEHKYAVCIVSNKYSPENYWNGRWQAMWEYSPETGSLNGHVKVLVHYYEDGNVQLAVEKKDLFEQLAPLSSISTGSDKDEVETLTLEIFEAIQTFEKQVQLDINQNYHVLSEQTFKDLRRKLPLTKSKIDWQKIANYNIGDALAGQRL